MKTKTKMTTTTTTSESTVTSPGREPGSFTLAAGRRFRSVDGAGAACSALCALHCGLASLAPSAFVFLGLGAIMSPALETGFVVAALVFAGAALWLGYRQHRAFGVAVLFFTGMIGLASGRLLEESGYEVGSRFTIAAGILLVVAHGYSWRLARRQRQAAAGQRAPA